MSSARDHSSGGKRRLFRPLLAGATPRERVIACIGAVIGIAATALVGRAALGEAAPLPFIVAPMGASAVLLFAVPSSPLAQPWSIVGGNTLSALVGVAVSQLVADPLLASGLAVGLAIAVMSLTRCLHPPGGAAALTAVIGGPAVAAAGFEFALIPVGLNSLLLAAMGLVFHRFSGHTYPHRPKPVSLVNQPAADLPPAWRPDFTTADIDAVLAEEGESFDISREDLSRLLHKVELRARLRRHGGLSCSDVMSRGGLVVDVEDGIEAAQALMRTHGLQALPVVDRGGRLQGVVGLNVFSRVSDRIAAVMEPAATAGPETQVFELIPRLTDGRTPLVAIISSERRLEGVVTPMDLIAALSRSPAAAG